MRTEGRALRRGRGAPDRLEVDRSQRERLIFGVADAVAREGYAATTIDQIAQAAGVSKKTFYKFFDSKEQAFLASYGLMEAVLPYVVDGAEDQASDAQAMVEGLVARYLRSLAAAPALAQMLIIEAIAATPETMRARAAIIRLFAAGIRRAIDLAREYDPSIDEISDVEVIALLGGLNELCVCYVSDAGDFTSIETVHADAVKFMTRFLGIEANSAVKH
ncbi:putative TetR family transcriptional regulator [[Mycobacterium] chelonae subsp. bovistauri]|nr:putative TetR family transcriptional regulator [Mycobacterium sp. QIA-37]